MAINKEYRCDAHGEFEAEDMVCPDCGHGHFCHREIRTPVGLKGNKTRFIDGSLNAIANDYGLTDMSNKDGRSVMENRRKPKDQAGSTWATDQIQHAKPGFSQRGEQAPTVNFSGLGLSKAPGGSFIEGVAKHLPKPQSFTHTIGRYNPRKLPKVSK